MCIFPLFFLANIVCRFFDGLRREFGSPATDNLYKVIRPFGVHSYFQPKKNILEVERAMEKALERDKSIQFDEAFFDQLIATYLGEGQNNGTNEKRQNNGTNEKRASLECQPVYKK
jgi:hypothetical protein